MIDNTHSLSLKKQCQLLDIHRSRIYYKPIFREEDTLFANELVELYRQYPIYGYRRLTVMLRRLGFKVNEKKVLRLMREFGLRALYPKHRTTLVNKKDYKYPNVLKDFIPIQPHQAWQIDITYLRTEHGFMYLNALIDVYSRTILGWCLSNSLGVEACLISLEQAIADYGIPEMIHSDQGTQFTSHEWISILQEKGILISMSGQGRSNDGAHIERLWRTLKYESLYIQGIRTVPELKAMLKRFVTWYNHSRPHQALGYKTPFEVLVPTINESQKGIRKAPSAYSLGQVTIINNKEKNSLK